jgi:hypothetical protein
MNIHGHLWLVSYPRLYDYIATWLLFPIHLLRKNYPSYNLDAPLTSRTRKIGCTEIKTSEVKNENDKNHMYQQIGKEELAGIRRKKLAMSHVFSSGARPWPSIVEAFLFTCSSACFPSPPLPYHSLPTSLSTRTATLSLQPLHPAPVLHERPAVAGASLTFGLWPPVLLLCLWPWDWRRIGQGPVRRHDAMDMAAARPCCSLLLHEEELHDGILVWCLRPTY